MITYTIKIVENENGSAQVSCINEDTNPTEQEIETANLVYFFLRNAAEFIGRTKEGAIVYELEVNSFLNEKLAALVDPK